MTLAEVQARIKKDILCNNGNINPNVLRQDSIFNKSSLKRAIDEQIPDNTIPTKIKIKLILSGRTTLPICRCGKQVNYGMTFNSSCSHKCAVQNPSAITKRQKTNLKRYGVVSYAKTNECKEKIKITTMARHGVEHPSQLESVKEKTKKTNLERYGGHHNSTSIVKEKTKKTNLERYGVTHRSQLQYHEATKEILLNKAMFVDFAIGKHKSLIAHMLNIDKTTVSEYIKKYECANVLSVPSNSKYESIISGYLDDLHIRYEQNTKKIISPLELDFYLPDYNVAIELNGNYWHSELAGKKDKDYHFNKWKTCRDHGIDLYSYFEDELIGNIEIIKSKLRYLGNQNTCVVGARKCIIKDTIYTDESTFLNEHHIQGRSTARNKTIGAYHNDKLVAVLGWMQRKQYLEITRFACDTKASYPGLFSKMMKHMITELDYTGEIVSFSNNGHSNGGVYKASGFQIAKILGPSYWYLSGNYLIRENRQGYMKNKIAKKFNYDMTDKTEWQAMQELGYDRIWDSGKIKWVAEIT